MATYTIKRGAVGGASPMLPGQSDAFHSGNGAVGTARNGWKKSNAIADTPCARVCNNSRQINAEERAFIAWRDCRPQPELRRGEPNPWWNDGLA